MESYSKSLKRSGSSEKKPDLRGFTLLEVMVAIAIIGGLLVTVLCTLNYHLDVAARHETITVATNLAEDLYRETEKKPEAKKGKFSDPYEDYSYEVIIADIPQSDIAQATITVQKDREFITVYGFVPGQKFK